MVLWRGRPETAAVAVRTAGRPWTRHGNGERDGPRRPGVGPAAPGSRMRATPSPSPCDADCQVEADVELDGVREQDPARDHAECRPPDPTLDDEVCDVDPMRQVDPVVSQGGV